MDLRQLATFRTITQTSSFSRTAETLNYAQSTVSAQIQALEEELGVALFDRLGKKIILTEAGKRLSRYAEKMLDLADEARAVVSEGDIPTGVLTISAPETLCAYRLPAVLGQFCQRFPQVQLIFRPEHYIELQRALGEGLMDVAFVVGEPFQVSSLVVEPLIAEQLLLIAYPNHRLTQLPNVSLTDLQHEPMLLTESTCSYRLIFERALTAVGVRPIAPMEFHSVEAIKQCVMAGMGLTFLPRVAVETEVAQGRLVPLKWTGPDFQLLTQMVWHKDKWLSPALNAFLNMARDVLATNLSLQTSSARNIVTACPPN